MADERTLLTGLQWECDDPSCDVCSMGARPDEPRAVWLARLRARFNGAPIPGVPLVADRKPIPMGECGRCGSMKRVNSPCIGCFQRGRARRVTT